MWYIIGGFAAILAIYLGWLWRSRCKKRARAQARASAPNPRALPHPGGIAHQQSQRVVIDSQGRVLRSAENMANMRVVSNAVPARRVAPMQSEL